MSGITADNLERSSGLVKAASVGPSSGSSDPVITTNPSAAGDRFINTTSGEVFVCTDATTDENVWKGQLGTDVEPPAFYGGRGTFAGGTDAVSSFDIIDYITIASLGNASDFGDRTEDIYVHSISCLPFMIFDGDLEKKKYRIFNYSC